MPVLGVLAGVSVLASEMPRSIAWPLALVAVASGVRGARVEAARPGCALAWRGDGSVALDGRMLAATELHWRGPLAFLRWRDGDGRTGRMDWWPDTLDAGMRRELRLAAGDASASRSRRRMAG